MPGLMSFEIAARADDATPAVTAAADATPDQTASQPDLDVIAVAPPSDAAAPTAQRANDDEPVQLEEVVVTTTKRPQAARSIPISMAVLDGEKLEELGIRKLKDIFSLVPGVNMQDEIGGLQRKISVRGAGPDTGTNQTVGAVFGDIPISDPYGATTIVDPNPWDMSTVEVLKGPQGTLFGATSLAGLIRYVPNYPKLGVWEGRGFYEYTMIDRGGAAPTYGAAFNVPIGDTLALRASGIFQKTPGVLDSDNPSREQKDVDKGQGWNGRVMALWQPLEQLTINAWYTKEERRADDINLVTLAQPTYSRDDAPTASPSANGYRLGTLDMRYAFDWATLVSLSGYQKKNSSNDVDSSYLVQPLAKAGISFLRSERQVQTHGFLQELRLVSPNEGKFTWVGGVYYSSFSETIRSRLNVSNDALDQLTGALPLDQLAALLPLLSSVTSLVGDDGISASDSGYDPLKANEQAIYGEANYDFTDQFRLTLGSRVYKTTVDGTLLASGVSSANNGASPGTTEKGWSPKVALTYRPFSDIMLYANASRGFQFGGFNLPTVPSPSIPLTFKSSSLWNYEIGARTDWFERTLRFDVTAFYLDWKNPQVSQTSPDGLSVYVDNVGGTHNLGVESTLRWLTPLHGLSIEQSGSYIEARTTTPFTDSSGTEIPKGTLFPSSPLVQAVTTLNYSHMLGAWLTQVSVINSLQGKSFSNIAHTTAVGDYDLLGVVFNVGRLDWAGSPSLTLSFNNLTNVQKLAAGFGPAPGDSSPTSSLIANSSYVYTQPRSIAMRLGLEF
jgi:iron complex outermembrane receptor protein